MFENLRRPYIIAEIGVNHGGNIDLAKKLIDLAKEGGANCAKFQSYKAEKIASKNSPAYWDTSKEPTKSQFELFKKYDSFSSNEYEILAEYCNNIGIDFLSTPFDLDAVDFLNPLMKYYKIASADITNIPLLRKVASKGKPILLSIGASYYYEVQQAIHILRKAGATEIIIMHCVLNYPTSNEEAYIGRIAKLRSLFPEFTIGYSDHTLPDEQMLILTSAWLVGASVLEKHFTYDKTLQGNDHYHSMDINDLKKLNSNIEFILKIYGEEGFDENLLNQESARLNARRSIVSSCKIRKGELFTEDNLTCKRPAHGISPIHWDEVIGKKASKDIEDDSILKWSDIN